MDIEATSDDGSLESAVAAITAKMKPGDESARIDTRENREDADITELEESTDLDEAEREEREAAAEQEAKGAKGAKNGKAPAEVEGEDGEEADADDDAQFIELPATEEGGEPLRIPVTEAVEAVQKLRQMDGDIATAVIRAEEEAFEKHDQITQQLAATFDTVAKQARIALQMMQATAPREPDPRDYSSTEGYYQAKLDFDAYVAHYHKVAATLEQSEQGRGATDRQQDIETVRRETERAARFIPEFKDEKTREAHKSKIFETLNKRYGVTKDDMEGVTDHKAWRMMNDLHKMVTAEKKAPEVRKQIQETKPKLKNGRVSPDRDPTNGQFLAAADKELREKGTEDAFVRKLLRSGALKGF